MTAVDCAISLYTSGVQAITLPRAPRSMAFWRKIWGDDGNAGIGFGVHICPEVSATFRWSIGPTVAPSAHIIISPATAASSGPYWASDVDWLPVRATFNFHSTIGLDCPISTGIPAFRPGPTNIGLERHLYPVNKGLPLRHVYYAQGADIRRN